MNHVTWFLFQWTSKKLSIACWPTFTRFSSHKGLTVAAGSLLQATVAMYRLLHRLEVCFGPDCQDITGESSEVVDVLCIISVAI